MTRPLHVAVLMGGWSAEREVSLTSGRGVAEALRGARPSRRRDRHGARRRRQARARGPRRRVQRAARHAGRGRIDAGPARHHGAALYAFGPRHLGDRDRQGADQAGARPPRHPHARGQGGGEREPVRRRSAAAPLCAEAGQRGLVGRRRDRHRRQQLRQPDRTATPKGRGSISTHLLAEPFIRGQRTDRRGARRGGGAARARRHRAQDRQRLLRLRRTNIPTA